MKTHIQNQVGTISNHVKTSVNNRTGKNAISENFACTQKFGKFIISRKSGTSEKFQVPDNSGSSSRKKRHIAGTQKFGKFMFPGKTAHPENSRVPKNSENSRVEHATEATPPRIDSVHGLSTSSCMQHPPEITRRVLTLPTACSLATRPFEQMPPGHTARRC